MRHEKRLGACGNNPRHDASAILRLLFIHCSMAGRTRESTTPESPDYSIDPSFAPETVVPQQKQKESRRDLPGYPVGNFYTPRCELMVDVVPYCLIQSGTKTVLMCSTTSGRNSIHVRTCSSVESVHCRVNSILASSSRRREKALHVLDWFSSLRTFFR